MNFGLYISKDNITYASFRFAKFVALSFGFFALVAAFFWALRRSCSRWFPPKAPRDFEREPTEHLRCMAERHGVLNSHVLTSHWQYKLIVIDQAKETAKKSRT